MKTFFFGGRLKNFCEDLFFFFGEHLCPWPRECLSSERLSLASGFFCVRGLEPCVLDSTSAMFDRNLWDLFMPSSFFFCLTIHRSNLDGGTRPPYNLSTGD